MAPQVKGAIELQLSPTGCVPRPLEHLPPDAHPRKKLQADETTHFALSNRNPPSHRVQRKELTRPSLRFSLALLASTLNSKTDWDELFT